MLLKVLLANQMTQLVIGFIPLRKMTQLVIGFIPLIKMTQLVIGFIPLIKMTQLVIKFTPLRKMAHCNNVATHAAYVEQCAVYCCWYNLSETEATTNAAVRSLQMGSKRTPGNHRSTR